VVNQVIHVNLEAEVLIVAHENRVKLISVLESILEVLVLDCKVADTPLCLDTRLELRSWKLHGRLKLALDDHLMTMLHVIHDRIHNGWILSERITRALLDLRVEIGVSCADNVRKISILQSHCWFILRVARTVGVGVGLVVDIKATIHELDITLKVILKLGLIETIAVKLGIAAGCLPDANIFVRSVEEFTLVLIVSEDDVPTLSILLVFDEDVRAITLVDVLREGLGAERRVTEVRFGQIGALFVQTQSKVLTFDVLLAEEDAANVLPFFDLQRVHALVSQDAVRVLGRAIQETERRALELIVFNVDGHHIRSVELELLVGDSLTPTVHHEQECAVLSLLRELFHISLKPKLDCVCVRLSH
jgi:hypothetical protein